MQPATEFPTAEGIEVSEARRDHRRSIERPLFWRQFINAADRADLPALAALALTRLSAEVNSL